MLADIAALKTAIQSEAAARRTEDDDIAETVDRYVRKLQGMLALINAQESE